MAAEDTEITLGAGKLLGLFLMLAATCGIFFAVGYSLGKTSAREQALKSQTAQAENADQVAESGKAVGVPAAGAASTKRDTEAAKDSGPDLTFYQAVKQDPRANSQSATESKSGGAAMPETGQKESHPKPSVLPAENASVAEQKPASESTQPSPQAGASGAYVVQIAAVTHEEDAAALAGALRKKSYAASVVNSPSGKDKLFHVVLGPYASLQDAEAMKSKLQGEGYNPIVKR
jgi:cell division septation protein DedD